MAIDAAKSSSPAVSLSGDYLTKLPLGYIEYEESDNYYQPFHAMLPPALTGQPLVPQLCL